MFSFFCALVTTGYPVTQLVFVLAGFAVCRDLFMLCVILNKLLIQMPVYFAV